MTEPEPEPAGLARPPVSPRTGELEVVALGRQSTHQGRLAHFELAACGPATPTAGMAEATLTVAPTDPDGPAHALVDHDADPSLVAIDTGRLPPRTYQVSVECGGGVRAVGRLFVYRQTGARRGEARSVLLVSAVALVAVLALRGRAGLTGRRGPTER